MGANPQYQSSMGPEGFCSVCEPTDEWLPQVRDSFRHECMCHSSDNSVCLSSRKSADYPKTMEVLHPGGFLQMITSRIHRSVYRSEYVLGS